MRKFENFINDENRDTTSLDLLPKYNVVVNLGAEEYVDDILKKGDTELLFRAAGFVSESPTEDLSDEETFEKIRQAAIDYYIKNPEAIGKGLSALPHPTKSGDGIPRTNNLGGALHSNSLRVGESKTEVNISPDEMAYFNTEEPLIELIRSGKIELGNGVVHYDSSDKETKKILDIYLEIDGSSTLEESLEYLTYTDRKKSSIVNLGDCGINFKINQNNIKSLPIIVEKFEDAFLFDTIDENFINQVERVSKSIFTNSKIKTIVGVSYITTETSHLLNINEGRYQVLTVDIINENYKTKLNLVKSVSDYLITSIVDIKKSIKDRRGKITEWVNFEHKELKENLTFICENKFENSGLKEFLNKICESL